MENEYEKTLEKIYELQRQLRELENSWTLIEPEANPRCKYCGRRIPITKGTTYTCPCGAQYLLEDFEIDYELGKAYLVFTDLRQKHQLEERYRRLREELEEYNKKLEELQEKIEEEEKRKAKEYLRSLKRRGYRVDLVTDNEVIINGRRISVAFDGEAYYPDTDDEELAEIIRELMLLHEHGYI